MKTINRLIVLLVFLPLIIFLSSCAKTAENEHLPEYCQTYSGFMATASKDLYDLVGGITRDEYLTSISVIELDFEALDPFNQIDLDGIQCFQNLTSLTLRGPGFKDISPISALKNIQEISLIDTSIVSIDSFKNLSKIKKLNITGTKTLQSVDGIEEMTKLTGLKLINNGIVNIDGLNNLINLENLDLSYNEISIFPNINRLTKLVDLNVSFNKIYKLGDDLSGLSALETLNMRNNDICNLEALDDLVSLEILDLSFNDLGCDGSGDSPDFSSLENSTELKTVLLNDNDLVSISGLEGLNIPLQTLDLHNNRLVDITPISEYTGITNLILYGNNIVNISNLSGMTGLTVIDLSKNSIVDFSDLLSIPNLEDIDLSNNSIISIPDLVTLEEEFWSRLIVLDLHSNQLEDISGVEGHSSLEELIISDNGLTTISGLSNLPELNYLEMTWEDPELPVEEWPDEYYSVTNPNVISTIINSFNNLPNLPLLYIEDEGLPTEIETDLFDFGFDLGDNLEIYGSISGLVDVREINFSGLDIDLIDEFSINLPNLYQLNVSNTNIEDIRFILGNPILRSLDISDTAVSNLSVISGLDTSDLDELDQVNAANISGNNHLLNAFIELPELSVVILEGTNIISIENSFNSLIELTTFRLDSVQLESIVDSFNDIFGFYRDENIIQINESKIGIISGSFNVGNYGFIEIIDNVSTGVTEITDSFNDLLTSDEGYINITGNNFSTISGSFNTSYFGHISFVDNIGTGTTYITSSFNNTSTFTDSDITISGNDFRTITDSFNYVTTSQLLLLNNFIEEITDSLVELDVVLELNLQNNRLETLVGLDLVSNVPILDLSSNRLNTVDFIDGIPGLIELDVSVQYDSVSTSLTLTTIDGINNMLMLETVIIDGNQITIIDGFKDIAITEFYWDIDDNNDIVIASITSDSFSNSEITILDLYGYDLNNIDFLTNFTSLIELSVSVNLADLSYFETAVFESILDSLTLGNLQNTLDFSSLSEYDNLSFLSFNSDTTVVINNLDGLNSLESLNFSNKTNIEEFNNSFNNMPNLTLTSIYLRLYTSLITIDNSFDIYTINDEVEVNGSITLVNSFNNVGEVVLASTIETTFNIDTLSFDNMDTLTIEVGNFDSYTILNNYTSLNTLTFELLNKNITVLDNSNITSLSIESTDITVDALTLDIALNGNLSVNSQSSGTLTLNTVNESYDIQIITGNVILNLDNTSANLSGSYSDFTLNSTNLVTVEFSNFLSTTTTFNTDLLNQITRVTTSDTNASTMTINSLEAILDINVNSTNLYINDLNANNYSLVVVNGNAYLNTNQIDLEVDFTGNNLYAQYNLLETIDLSGSLSNLILESTSLNTATLNNATIATATVTSNQAILDITGTNITNLDIINNSINNLTASVPGADVTLTTSNNQTLDLSSNASVFELVGTNIPEVIINTISIISNFNITGGTVINTLTFNNADIDSLVLTSSEATLNITGTNLSSIDLDMANLNAITAVTTTADYNIDSTVTSININMRALTVAVDSPNMTSMYIQSSSIIDTLQINESSSIDTITANDALITLLVIDSEAPSMTITSTNIPDTVLNNGFITDVTANIGSNDIVVNSTKTGTASFDIIASNVELSTLLSTITINNASVIGELKLNSNNLSSVNSGIADISLMLIESSSVDLDIVGTNLTYLTIYGISTTLDISVELATEVIVNHNENSLLTISTNTSDITVYSSGDIDLTSSTLITSGIYLGTKNAILNLTTPALNFVIEGEVNDLTISSTSLNNLDVGAGFIANEIELLNTNITSLDFSTGTVSNLVMNGNTTTTLSITGNDLSTILLDMPDLNTLTANSTNVGTVLTVNGSDSVLDFNGTVNSVTILEVTLSSLDLLNSSINNLTVNSEALSSLNTESSVNNTLEVTVINDNFNLVTDVPDVTFNSISTYNLNLTTSSVVNMNLSTNVDSINFNADLTTVSISGDNINNLIGSTEGIIFAAGIGTGVLSIDLDTDDLYVDNTTYNQIDLSGVRSVPDIIVGGSNLVIINTNTVAINNLTVNNSASNLAVDTEATNIIVNGLASNSVSFDISVGGQTIESALTTIGINSTNSSSTTLLYTGSSIIELTSSGLSDVNFTAPNSSSIVLVGDVVNISVSGSLIDSVDTTLFTTSNKYTMNSTLVDNLTFVSAGFAASLVELEIDSLSLVNVSDIVEKLRDTGITLLSPITSDNIYDDFYDSEFADLTTQEELDSARYNGFRDTVILDAFTEIRTNTYFDYINDTTLNSTIDDQSYGDMQSYLDGYIEFIETTEAQLIIDEGDLFVQAIRDSIQFTLDETVLVIVEVDLSNSVDQSIIDDSSNYATIESGLIGFTIG